MLQPLTQRSPDVQNDVRLRCGIRAKADLNHPEPKTHININLGCWVPIVGTRSQKADPCQFTGPRVLCASG